METSAATAVATVHLDALPLGQSAATPWDFSPAWFVLLALVIPALAWLALAWKRALDEDPQRLRRKGQRELARLLRQLGRHGASPAAAHLHAWMRAAARTWGVTLSTPTPLQIARAVESQPHGQSEPARWYALWHATERGLYAPEAKPPGDWLDQAASAAAEVRIPKRERWFPNRRRHWLPAIMLLALLGAGAQPGQALAQAPLGGEVALPDAADLGPAREAAEAALKADPRDWAAHHNIAAWNLQQHNWNAAVAHGTAAFLRQPSSRATRENLAFALTQVQGSDLTLRRLVSGRRGERMGSWMSAAGWQRLGLAASLVLAAGLTLAVLGIYRTRPRALVFAGRGAIVAGAMGLALAIHGWDSYGRLADPRAGMLVLAAEVLPEPTDLTPREESSPAPAGTVVVAKRDFLTWQQVEVREDLTGWVRQAEVLPFYAAPQGTP